MRRKKQNAKIGFSFLKYIVAVSLIAYIIVVFIWTGGSNKSFDTIAQSVEAVVNSDNMTKAETQSLKRYYGLNGFDYDGVTLYISAGSMSAEELLLIQAKTEEQVSEIQNAIETRRESRREEFEGYASDQVDLIDSSVFLIRGKYVFFTISKDAAKYKEAFTSSL